MNLLMVNDAILAVNSMRDEIAWAMYGIEQVYVAYNVREGQDVISSSPVDILLCDIEMPGDNGIALIRWIREKGYDIDCILLTCHADFAYAQEAIKLGCQDYILLPSSYEAIGQIVLKVVGRRRERLYNDKLQEYGRTWLHSQEAKVRVEETKMTPAEIAAQCISYIMEHLCDENLSVNEVASHFYLNAIYLNRIFKKETGSSISQYIIREKMTLAASLLKDPNSSAAAVAVSVGYPNYPYFSTLFKKYYGCPPSQYRGSGQP